MPLQLDRGIAVIGLGRMGLPMARVLKNTGAEPLCYDISCEARAAAENEGLRTCTSVSDAFATCGIVVLSLPNAAIVETTISDGLTGIDGGLSPTIIDASTSTAETSRKMALAMQEAGGAFLDAPVSGGPAGAASGSLTFMVGGPAEIVERCRPVFETLGKKVLHAGDVGSGNIAKIANNMMVAAHFVVARECLALAQSAGLSPEDALGVVNSATGGSTVTQVHFPNWVTPRSFDSGFSMALMRKDIGLAEALADGADIDVPMIRLARELWNAPDAPGDEADFTEMGDPDRVRGASAAKEARTI